MSHAPQKRTSQGKGIRCTTCGGTFPLSTLAAGVHCPFCGAQQSMTATAVVQARQYRDDVFAEMRGADAEHGRVAAWSQWSSGSSAPNLYIGLIVAMTVVPTLLSIPAYLLSIGHVEVPDELHGALSALGSLCTVGMMLAMVIGFVVWASRSQKARRTSTGEVGPASKVACPHCGAPNHLRPGQHVQTCGHCSGALMPSRTLMVAGLDAAKAARRQALLERYRAERAGMLGMAQYTGRYVKVVPLIIGVSMLPVLLTFCAFPFGDGGLHVTVLGTLLVGIPLLLVFAFVASLSAFLFVRWRERTAAWKGALGDLARQFHGRVSTDVGEFVSWLNRSWAGAYDVRFVGGGSSFGAVLLDAWGFSVAVALNPAKSATNPYETTPTYARIMLAAWIPSRSDGGPPPLLDARAKATMQWLASAGFLVSCEEAGILAMAEPHVVSRLRKDPGAAHQLAPVIGHLARLAQEIGAQPVALMPGPAR